MSLTNPFGIQQNEIKNIIKEFCPEKESFRSQNGTTCFNTKKECMVPSSLDSSDANLCGTAFDYVARFFIAQKISNNKCMATKELMAENIFSYRYFRQININIHKIQKSGICIKNTNSIVCGNLSKWLEKECNINKYKIENLCDAGILKVSYINTADLDDLKLQYDKFIEPIKKFIVSENNDEGMIIEKSIILAKLEQIVRSSKDYVNIDNMYCFSDKYSKVKEELYKLLDSFKKVFLPIVKKDSVVIFNPRFGIGSQVIGGADADIFIDGILYDFKVVKKNGWSSKNVTQIVKKTT